MSDQTQNNKVPLTSDYSLVYKRTQKPRIPLSFRHGATLPRVVVADELDMSQQALGN